MSIEPSATTKRIERGIGISVVVLGRQLGEKAAKRFGLRIDDEIEILAAAWHAVE